MPAKGWKVEDGILKKIGGERGGDIITQETFDNFDLLWEWRISPAGNNGIKYFVTEDRPCAPGHEYQMIDDAKNPDAKVGPHRATGSFYDVLPPADDKPLRPAGEWNQSRVLIQGNHVEHWLNGKKVLAYELGSDAVTRAVARSKFKNTPGFGEKIRGHIMLTDHHDECWFRNIKIQELIGPIAVTGTVQHPGQYYVSRPATIQKALDLAGLGEFAGRGTEIVRAGGGVEHVSYKALRSPKSDIPLYPGDKIIVRSWE